MPNTQVRRKQYQDIQNHQVEIKQRQRNKKPSNLYTLLKMAIALSGSSDGNNIAGTSSQVASENKKIAKEMVGACSVCSDDQGTEENSLVYCDGCEVAVHQACYGIVDVPPGEWFCRKCELGESQNKIKCELCPSEDGALKKTEAGLWAHVVCALYIPEVRFGNNNTMEPIEIKHIQADRFSKRCYLCEEGGNSATAAYGAVMDCKKHNCKLSFHVTCAQTAGLLCEEDGTGSGDNVTYCGYCKHHFRKLKAVNRKNANSLNNSSTSYLDSASDSSQDNDSRCNTAEQDKNTNRTNKPASTSTSTTTATTITTTTATIITTTNMPSSLPMSNTPAANSHSTSPSSVVTSSSKTTTSNNLPISLTIPLNPTTSLSNNKISSSSSNTAQKKKRNPKNVQNNPSTTTSSATNNSSTLLATTVSQLPNLSSSTSSCDPSSTGPFTGSAANNPTEASGASQDVYKWSSSSSKDEHEKPPTNNNKTNSKKKQSASNAQSTGGAKSSSAAAAASNAQSSLITSYNLNKIVSPNLSLSTSPSLASPSNSTKSTSSISTTAASSSSSSSSTSSNSPSPALLSPNVSNRVTSSSSTATTTSSSSVRLESPLASNSKTGNNNSLFKALPESSLSSVALLPLGQNSIQTRINLDNPKNDPKKNPLASSSLLSTAVPMPHESLATSGSSSSNTTIGSNSSKIDAVPSLIQTGIAQNNNNNKTLTGGLVRDSLATLTGQGNNVFNGNTQPTVPPLIIPVPLPTTSNPTTNSTTKSTAKPKTSAKSTRKKSIESNECPKPEPKPKASRSKKATATANNNNNNTVAPVSKPEPKRGKGKVVAKSGVANSLTTTLLDSGSAAKAKATTAVAAASPSKRKSRSASNESSSAAPSPAKRSRKKKADQTAQSNDQSNVVSSNNALGITNSQFLSAQTSNTLIGTSPLMVNTPNANNRLLTSLNSGDGQDVSNRYFSPMISPYANFDHSNAPSLTRSSLSRLFTSSSVNNTNQTNLADDPAKAFEELRDNTWSHLSKYVLEQAQQFDIPSLIGTLYTLRSENEKLVNRVRDLTMKKDQLAAMSARLDLPGPMLTQHLNNTSPNFSSVVSGLANSPKSLPAPSPGAAIAKQPPHVSVGPFNHVAPGPLGPPGYLDRSSPLVGQTHSGLNNIKSSISTPSPPIGALMAHSTSNRAGLITVNPPFISNVFPTMSLGQLGTNSQSSSYYPRQ